MASKVDICNWALTDIGAQTIQSLESSDKSARRLAIIYPLKLQELLEDFDWSFATKVQALVLAESAPLSGYAYAYQRPADCVRLSHFGDPDADRWEIIGDRIHTDKAQAVARFVYLITDTAKFPMKFARALAAALASDLAFSIQQKDSAIVNRYEAKAEDLLSRAKAADAMENRKELEEKSIYETALGEVLDDSGTREGDWTYGV
jgi:hypothetical protein